MTVGEAWDEAAALVPDDWNGPSIYQKSEGLWHAYAVKRSLLRPMPVNADGATAEEALRNLAIALKDRGLT